MTWLSDHFPDSSLEDWALEMATTTEADSYLELRGKTDWVDSEDDDAKNQALQRAWDYLSGLDWYDDVFDTELPVRVKNAQIVAAYEEFLSPGCLQPSLSAENYLESKNLAGAIVKTYRANAPVKKRFLEIESLVRQFVRNLGGCCVELRRG